MFRIQGNVPATPSLTQQLAGLRFDGRQPTQQATGVPGAAEQMRVVGEPTVVEARGANVNELRQTNLGVASAATVSHVLDDGLANAQVFLQRLFQVTLRAQDANLSESERQRLQEELNGLRSDMDEMSNSVRFNGIPLMNGAQRALTFQLGPGPDSGDVHLTLVDARTSALLPGVSPEGLATAGSARAVGRVIGEALNAVRDRRAKVEGFQDRLTTALSRREPEDARAVRSSEDAQALLMNTRRQALSAPSTALLAQINLLSQEAMALIRP